METLATAKFRAIGEDNEFNVTLEMGQSGAFDYGNGHALCLSTTYPGSMDQVFDARYDDRFNTVESFNKNAYAFVRDHISGRYGLVEA